MRTNADLTLYNKYFDPATKKEVYQRTEIKGVVWQNRKARNVLASGGNIAADQAVVYIPKVRGENYLKPLEWAADKDGNWTLHTGDIIVKGIVANELSDVFTPTDLKKAYDDVLVISSVDTMDIGSVARQHWKVSAK